MAFNITSVRTSLALAIAPKRSLQQALTNSFNEAFFAFVGAGLTKYDSKSQTYLDKGYNENADVYAVVSQISRKFASVPGLLKQNDKEVANPLPRPNYYQSESEYKELWETFMLLNGNAYQWILSPEDGANSGVPMARFLLPSHLIQIVLKKDASMLTTESPIDHYLLVIGNSYIQFKAEDVIHSKFPNPNYDLQGSHLYGRSPLSAALTDIQLQNVTKDNSVKVMKNGGVYGFIHAKDGQTPLTAEQAAELKSRLLEMQSSDQALSRIAGASAPLGFTQISIDTDKLQPFEYLKSAQKQICNVLGWSDLLMNNDAKYDNINSVWKMAISNRIAPDLLIYEDGLNTEFYPRFKDKGLSVKFDVSEMQEMQEDMVEKVGWMLQLLNAGVLTRNEVRIGTSYPEATEPEMNQYTVLSGIVPIEDINISDDSVDRSFNVDQ